MNNRKKSAYYASGLVVLGLAFALAGCGSGSNEGSTTTTTTTNSTTAATVSLTGAGSTFVNPAMSKWIDEYKKTNAGIDINYQAVGSGAGISQYQAGTVDFGATDAPVGDDDLKSMPPTIQIPVVSGAVALTYNLPGVTAIKLSPDAIAGMFLGKITKWNDPKIAADNAGVKLPDTAVAIAHRSDSSGTSYIFTNYLAAISADWKSGPGVGKSVNWPVGTGGKGSDGVAGVVKQTPGGIGYVELAYAIKNGMGVAQVKNAAGEFITPSIDSTAAATAGKVADLKKDVRTPVVNSSAKGAYPICGFTYVLIAKTPKDAAKSKALVDFLNWSMDSGQDMIKDLQYAPLPKDLVDMNKQSLSTVAASK